MILYVQTAVADAHMADWLTVTAYLLAAFMSARAAAFATSERRSRDRHFWRVTCILLVFLGINKLLDLQTILTSLGRAHAKANGWYEERRAVQYVFVMALGAAAALTGLAMLWLTRRTRASVRLALAGLIFIGLFVLLRAASFHHLDELLGRGFRQFNWRSLQEMTGIIIVAAAAAAYAIMPNKTGQSRAFLSEPIAHSRDAVAAEHRPFESADT